MTTQADIRFVLVRPRNSGNVGAAVRALRNFGFPAPRVVDMYRFEAEEARRMAAGCEAAVDDIEFFSTMEEALADRSFVAGTTGQGRTRWRLEPIEQGLSTFLPQQWERAAILFGNEKSGLSDDELGYCERVLTIPTVDYHSLNLAQAVLITAWEVRRAVAPQRLQDYPQLATREQIEPMFEQMFAALEAISYLHPGQEAKIRTMMRQLFGRNGLTPREVQIMRGIWHQVLWLASTRNSGEGEEPGDKVTGDG